MKKKNKIEKINVDYDFGMDEELRRACYSFQDKINELVEKVNELESKIDKLALRKVFYVDNNFGSDANSGKSPEEAFCTEEFARNVDNDALIVFVPKPKPSTQFGH